MIYIAICLSRCEGESRNYLVEDADGNSVFATEAAVDKEIRRDLREYAKAERAAGYKVKISGDHIEWNDDTVDREAKWYRYAIDPEDAVPKKKGKK